MSAPLRTGLRRLLRYCLPVVGLLVPGAAMAAPLIDEIESAAAALADSPFADDIAGLRQRSVRDAAFTVAFQSGVWHRNRALFEELEAIQPLLGRTFDMGRLLLNAGRVVPPVIEEAGASLRLHSEDEGTESALTWRILRPARLATVPPSWRDYLMGSNPEPGRPHRAVLPKDEAERSIWRNAARAGWRAGIEEADLLFRERLAALERDFVGMIRFKLLADQRIVGLPMLAEGELGIVVDGNRLSLDERVFRIQRPTQFNPESRTWMARPIPKSR